MKRSPCKTCRTAAIVLLLVLANSALGFAEQPTIGLIYATHKYTQLEDEGKDAQGLYREALEENGAAVVVLSQTFSGERIDSLLTDLDGILLPGGIDVEPKFYHEERHECLGDTDAALDKLEFRVLDYAKERGLPVFGVCRGLQVLNVYYGGSLIQDIPSEYEGECVVVHRRGAKSEPEAKHPIRINKGSLLRSLLGAEEVVVNSSHHQAVKDLAPGFVVTARSEDGIAEAIERRGELLVFGVQFHPERLRPDDRRFNGVFKHFVEQAEMVKRGRTAGK